MPALARLAHIPEMNETGDDARLFFLRYYQRLQIGRTVESTRGAHHCTVCGCFYEPTEGAVCATRLSQMLKERVL